MRRLFEKMLPPQKEGEIRDGKILLEGRLFDSNDSNIFTCNITGIKWHGKYTNRSINNYIGDLTIINNRIPKSKFNPEDSRTFHQYRRLNFYAISQELGKLVDKNGEFVVKTLTGGTSCLYCTEDKKKEIIERLGLVQGVNNPDVYFDENELEVMDKPKPYRKFDNTFDKIDFKDVIDKKLLASETVSPEVIELKKNILKRNIEMGVESLTFKELEGQKYTFGIELETCEGRLDPEEVAHLNVKAVHDGSLREADGSNPIGGEYVTGILVGDAGLAQLHEICRVLQTKCKLDKRCGVHVHIGGLNWSKEDVVFSWILAEQLELEIFNTLPKSRRTNTYCRELRKLIGPNIDSLRNAKSIQEYNIEIDNMYDRIFTEVSGLHPSEKPSKGINKNTNHPKGSKCGFDKNSQRYCWLNYVTLLFNTKGPANSWTLEFRPMSGTLNYTKIKNWLKLCMAFCSFVENHKGLIKNSLVTPLNLETVINHVYSKTGGKLNSYIKERKQLFGTADESVDYAVDRNIAKKSMREVACAS